MLRFLIDQTVRLSTLWYVMHWGLLIWFVVGVFWLRDGSAKVYLSLYCWLAIITYGSYKLLRLQIKDEKRVVSKLRWKNHLVNSALVGGSVVLIVSLFLTIFVDEMTKPRKSGAVAQRRSDIRSAIEFLFYDFTTNSDIWIYVDIDQNLRLTEVCAYQLDDGEVEEHKELRGEMNRAIGEVLDEIDQDEVIANYYVVGADAWGDKDFFNSPDTRLVEEVVVDRLVVSEDEKTFRRLKDNAIASNKRVIESYSGVMEPSLLHMRNLRVKTQLALESGQISAANCPYPISALLARGFDNALILQVKWISPSVELPRFTMFGMGGEYHIDVSGEKVGKSHWGGKYDTMFRSCSYQLIEDKETHTAMEEFRQIDMQGLEVEELEGLVIGTMEDPRGVLPLVFGKGAVKVKNEIAIKSEEE
ncbi:hypothetical protein JD969_14970 [Planctomycetota bacterium]|nr:hypothetical protein JD969_14970 [Planctomycetota bacterium]